MCAPGRRSRAVPMRMPTRGSLSERKGKPNMRWRIRPAALVGVIATGLGPSVRANAQQKQPPPANMQTPAPAVASEARDAGEMAKALQNPVSDRQRALQDNLDYDIGPFESGPEHAQHPADAPAVAGPPLERRHPGDRADRVPAGRAAAGRRHLGPRRHQCDVLLRAGETRDPAPGAGAGFLAPDRYADGARYRQVECRTFGRGPGAAGALDPRRARAERTRFSASAPPEMWQASRSTVRDGQFPIS